MYKIFDCQGVPSSELKQVHELLERNRIRYYRTPGSVKTPSALWVRDENGYRKAMSLLCQFEANYAAASKQMYTKTLNEKYGGSNKIWFSANLKRQRSHIWLWVVIAVVLLGYALRF